MICPTAANSIDRRLGCPGVLSWGTGGDDEQAGKVASKWLWLVTKIAPALRETGIKQAIDSERTSNGSQHKRRREKPTREDPSYFPIDGQRAREPKGRVTI